MCHLRRSQEMWRASWMDDLSPAWGGTQAATNAFGTRDRGCLRPKTWKSPGLEDFFLLGVPPWAAYLSLSELKTERNPRALLPRSGLIGSVLFDPKHIAAQSTSGGCSPTTHWVPMQQEDWLQVSASSRTGSVVEELLPSCGHGWELQLGKQCWGHSLVTKPVKI